MKALDSFLKNNEPQRRVSQLKEYKSEILQLYKNDFKVEQIQDFLKTQKVEITKRRIWQFVKENLDDKNFSLKTPSASSTSKKKQSADVLKSDDQDTKAIIAYKQKLQKIANQNNNEE